MGYCDYTTAHVFALTRLRRLQRKAWLDAQVGGIRYWGSPDAAAAAAARYEAWRVESQAAHRATKEFRRRPPGNLVLDPITFTKMATRLFKIQDGRCYLSGEPFTKTNPPTWEHVMPRCLGGINHRNRLLAGFEANTRKAGRPPYPCELIYLAAVNAILEAQEEQNPKKNRRIDPIRARFLANSAK